MPWVLIILIVIVAAGLIGLLAAKIDELSGIGREHRAGSWRWPHGKVVRTRVLSAEQEIPGSDIAKKVLAPTLVIAFVAAALTMVGPLTGYGNAFTVVSLLASLIVATCVVGKNDAGRAFCYAVVGLAIACTVLILITRAYVSVSTAEVNAFTAIFGAAGASVGSAILPARVIFAREFADGKVGCVRLSQRTAAAALLLKLQDKQWDVPEHVREAARRMDRKSAREDASKAEAAAGADAAARRDAAAGTPSSDASAKPSDR